MFRCLSIVLFATIAFAARADDFDPDAFVASLAEVNRVWTDPAAGPLSYQVTSGPVGDTPLTTGVNRVWCFGRRARWELDVSAGPDKPPHMRYALVTDGPVAQYVRGPEKLMGAARIASRDLRLFRQGVICDTAMHIVCAKGLPSDTRVVASPPKGEAGLMVLETDLGTNRLSFGLGILHSAKGRASGRLGKVRLTVRVPEMTPVSEEYPDGDGRIEYAEPFLVYGDGRAPSTVRYVSTLSDGDTPWVLEQVFQKVGQHWLLDHAKNIQGGETIVLMKVEGVSTEPIREELLRLPTAM